MEFKPIPGGSLLWPVRNLPVLFDRSSWNAAPEQTYQGIKLRHTAKEINSYE
jgi:hypothetical protein